MGMAYLGDRQSCGRARRGGRLAGAAMIGRILHRIFSAEIMGLLLVVGALQVLTFGVAASLRNTDTRYFFWVCFLAAMIAFGLSRRGIPAIPATAGIIGLGVLGIWIIGARLAAPIIDFGNEIIRVIPQIIPAIRSDIPVETTGVSEAWLAITQAATALALRVQVWMMGVDRNVIVNDPLVRNLAWMLIMWLLSAWLGWFTARRNAVAALLP